MKKSSSVLSPSYLQELRSIQSRLNTILQEEIPNFIASRAAKYQSPILDCSQDAYKDDQIGSPHEILGLKKFEGDVAREIDFIEKYLTKHAKSSSAASQTPLSTNAPYVLAVWSEIISSEGVLAIGKTFDIAEQRARSKHTSHSKNLAEDTPTQVKVDVVSENGRKWVRVNTLTNARLARELYELGESGDPDSSEGEEEIVFPLGAAGFSVMSPPVKDSSLLRMGKALLLAAQRHRISGPDSSSSPTVAIRLTRLDPSSDPLIAKAVAELEALGVIALMGERPISSIHSMVDSSRPPPVLVPSLEINLDLSVLIALVTDITHADPPSSKEEAYSKFIPRHGPIRVEGRNNPSLETDDTEDGNTSENSAEGIGIHGRALALQALQEAKGGLISTIQSQIELARSLAPNAPVKFYTTPGAKDRCLKIVNHVGGTSEKRRAFSMFEDDGREQFWYGSRYTAGSLAGLIPISIWPSDEAPASSVHDTSDTFSSQLRHACRTNLSSPHPVQPPPRPTVMNHTPGTLNPIAPAPLSSNPRLTIHTVQTLLYGAEKNVTTLTANRASVKAILRGIREIYGRVGGLNDDNKEFHQANIWIVEPRSLAEEMRVAD